MFTVFCQALFIHSKLWVPIVSSCMLLDGIALHEYATVNSFVHLLIGI